MAREPTGRNGDGAKGPPIQVFVRAWLHEETGKVDFDHEWVVTGKPEAHKGRIDIPAGTPPTEILFHLKQDDTGLGLSFCTPATEAMYVNLAPTCPTSPGNGGQISFPKAPSQKLLQVEDANSGPACDLKYALRFDGAPNSQGNESPPYAYDPALRNGGNT